MLVMITHVDLSKYDYIFESTEIADLKNRTYIYGKNGTGKSTIVKALQEQYGNTYELNIFQGFNKIIANKDSLDALILGVNNTEIQSKIDVLNQDIDTKLKDISSDLDNPGVLFTANESNKSDLEKANNAIKSLYTDYARTISEELNLGRIYRRNNFRDDIQNAQLLSIEDQKKYQQILDSKKIQPLNIPELPFIQFEGYLKSTNQILQDKVTPKTSIDELKNDSAKQAFAHQGMTIHHPGEKCAFCGQTITQHRWDALEKFFSDAVTQLENRISSAITKIDHVKASLATISPLDTNHVYPVHKPEVELLNTSLITERDNELAFLNNIENKLRQKQNNIFVEMNPLTLDTPEGLQNVYSKISSCLQKNLKLDSDLDEEQDMAQTKLRLNLVARDINSKDYKGLIINESALKAIVIKSTKALEDENLQYQKLKIQKSHLISQLTNEKAAAENINTLLHGLGNCSFSLKYLQNEQNGLYQIIDKNGSPRSIHKLSTGEKNIVAFLYFMNSLKEVHNQGKEQVIILDDPMNSNDDMTQYLMIGVITEFLNSQNHPQLIILTHNTHFYMQVRPTNMGRKYGKYSCYHLQKTDKTTISKINRESEDIKTMYLELWDELHFAYDQERSLLMWNSMRRIIESYNRFVYKNDSPRELTDKIVDSSERTLYLSLLKGTNVNSHSGLETDMDISTFNVETLKISFYNLFKDLDAEKHFNAYWDATSPIS